MSTSRTSVVLSKLDTSAEDGLTTSKAQLSSYLMNQATQRDNSSIIANAILNETPMSAYGSAQVVNISVNLDGYIEALKRSLENALTEQFRALSAPRRALLRDMKTEWDPQSNTMKTQIQVNASTDVTMSAIRDNIAEIEENGIRFEPTMVVLDIPPAGPPAPGTSTHGSKVQYQSCIRANEEDVRRGQYKLSSSIDLILDEKILRNMNSYIRVMTSQNEWNPDQAGRLKWDRLEHLFDNKKETTLNQIMKYVNFMKSQRKEDETLSEYVASLREAVTRLKRKKWSLNEIIAVLCYADIISSEDKTTRGIKFDYSDLKKELKLSFKDGKFIHPDQIELRLEEIAEEAKGGNELAIQSGKAFLGKRSLNQDHADESTKMLKALKAQVASLQNQMKQNKKSKKGNKAGAAQGKENEEYTDNSGKKRRRVIKMKKGKYKGQWAKIQPPVMPGNRQFTSEAKFCWQCKKKDDAQDLPSDGWSEKSVNGRVAHTTDQHKLLFPDE